MEKDYERKCYELAYLIFPDVHDTVEDLEVKYPVRRLKKEAKVTRLAPSPTGFLHTGTLFTALVDQKLAKQSEGIFYLRVEDTDTKREVKDSVKLLTKELKEFGFIPDEGVISETEEKGFYGPYTQSKRADIYKICAKHLVEKGLAYPCFCTPEKINATRESQEKNKIVPGYYGVYATCRNISIDESIRRVKEGEPYILRFRSSGSHLQKTSFIDGARGKIELAQNDQDIVLIKGDGLPTYHFAHVVDDHFMRTTHVVRGEEWIPSTPIHLELFEAMGFEAPTYVHIPLIQIKDGISRRKLSKRKDKEAAVSHFLKAGYPVEGVMEYLMTILNSDFEMWRNQNKEKEVEEFTFRLNKLSSAGSLLDLPKLHDICKETIAKMDSKEVLERVLAWSKEYDEKMYQLLVENEAYARSIFALERDGAKKIRKDIAKWEDILPTFFYFFSELYEKDIEENGYEFDCVKEPNEAKLTKEKVKEVLLAYQKVYDIDDTKDEWFEKMKQTASELGFCTDMKVYKQNPDAYVGSTADFAGTIRISIVNRKNSPDIYEIMKILGKEEVRKRWNQVIEKL